MNVILHTYMIDSLRKGG